MTVFCYAKPPILSIVKRKGYLCHLPAQKFLLHVLWQAAWQSVLVPTQITMKKSSN